MEGKKDNNTLQIIKDDEIDLIALAKVIWEGRRIIYYCVGIAIFIGLLIAFLSPAKYTVSATLLPSAEKKMSSMGGLGALAGMAGINLGSMMGQSTGIPAEIYPQVVNSYPFLNELIHEKFNFEEYEQPVSIYEYVVNDTIESFSSQIAKYTIRLPWTIKEAIFSRNENKTTTTDFGVLNLSEEEVMALESVKELIQIEVNQETGLVSLTVESREPIVTAQYVQKAVELLQQYIIAYKTKQSRENLKFVQVSYEEKKAEYESLQKNIFNYKDRHRNLVSERLDPEYQRLSDAYELSSSIYNELAKQLEQAKIAVKEETPAFTILEPAKVPIEKSAPKKKIILVLSVFLGGFIGVCFVFGKLIWNNFLSKLAE
ncbi:Wzz/FepE/Etk N-terminal domain-containing protein [Carboxylicivirga caseinilyticus]|uniref:Wzz/FepE/Etk N-terminal domain-containing protein n=1 Tax=Carboxylicivirga caseinilyticus TaxID=3417572 RepID=UPI003D339C9E|nr:lipopolysaccharide biosynthesis protein [Marinilabiliaceae bacterium A049]